MTALVGLEVGTTRVTAVALAPEAGVLRCAEVNYEPSSPHAGLTGEIPTDVADASGTLLFDAGARAWSREIARLFEIDPAWLPPPESPEACGQTASGVVVAAGARDQELYPALRRFAS